MRNAALLALLTSIILVILVATKMHRESSAAKDPPRPSPLRGRIVARGAALSGACVRYKGTTVRTKTDTNGRFLLPAPGSRTRRVTASKDGFFIAGVPVTQSPLVLKLEALPAKDNEDYQWIDPGPKSTDRHACAKCHKAIYDEWRGSGHSRSATGKHFLNLYEGADWNGNKSIGWSLADERPNGAGVCVPCHAPSVSPGEAAFLNLSKARGVQALGVHCDYCHKIQDAVRDAEIGSEFGRHGLKLLRPAKGQLFFGPLDDVDRGEDAFSAFYKDSRYCAYCHEGVVFGAHVYSTYSEWRNSPAKRRGQQCQDCHLKPTGEMTNVAPGRGGIERDPQTLGNHRFWNGSQEKMLKESLRVNVDLRERKMLAEATLTVQANGVGHRVPTGFSDRQLILVISAHDKRGNLLEPVGNPPRLPEAAGPKLAKKPGRLYAKLLRDADGIGPVPFWLADGKVIDTRLYPEKPDVLTIRYPHSLAHLKVKLLYRRFWQETITLKLWPDRDLVVIDKTFSKSDAPSK